MPNSLGQQDAGPSRHDQDHDNSNHDHSNSNHDHSNSNHDSGSTTVDKRERERLDTLHAAHTLLLSPAHDELISAHLADVHRSGRRSTVLDVGTGTGTWAFAMGRQHPFADIIGVDINWSAYGVQDSPHGNVEFRTVDLIHVKAMVMDIPHYPQLVERLAVTLKPRGLMILVESSMSFECIDGTPSAVVASWCSSLRDALATKNSDIDLPRNLDRTVAATGVFTSEFFFQEVGCPVGAYMRSGSERLLRAGRLHASVIQPTLWRLISSRLEPGPRRRNLESLSDECARDLISPSSRYIQRLFAVYAFKRPSSDRLLPRHRHSY
ncbi:Secondary metabolism regulator laeA [Vanrija pseudolonga]|uniref:Secondary metabolism regulator laeA n=1 Tax=Vanrija pseudolonga TaxID=143232 RepID=A0AAF1BEL8_9TREE|nr:Secondary metabolism regulator laeA [Vanrija pseudolonga]